MLEGMVTPGRLELPTRSLGNCCSIHLSYGATMQIVRGSFRKLLDFSRSALAGRGHLSYGATMQNRAINRLASTSLHGKEPRMVREIAGIA